MDKELIRDYFRKSGFTDMQANALAQVLAELATKEDLAQLKAELTWRVIGAMAVFAAIVSILDAVIE